MKPIIIIGSGLAGYTFAREFRKLDQTTPLQIFTRDAGNYYSKPQLSSAFTHHKKAADLATATTSKMQDQLKLEVFPHTLATGIDPEKKLLLVGEKTFPYEKLVLAQGAEVVKAPLQGNAVSEVMHINNLEDYELFRQKVADKKRIVILGAGLVGCEFANDLLSSEFSIEMVALAKTPLDLLLPPELGLTFQKAMAEKNVKWHLECSIETINYSADKTKINLTLSNNTQIETDIVLSAIGLRPALQLAKSANLAVNRGIIVDELLQTSNPDIFAIGDCAEVAGYVMFYVAPLVLCAKTLAATLTGKPTKVSYPPMPVILKTPVCPVVVNPPPPKMLGHWEINGSYPNQKALFYDKNNQLQGFALTGDKVLEKMALAKELPTLF